MYWNNKQSNFQTGYINFVFVCQKGLDKQHRPRLDCIQSDKGLPCLQFWQAFVLITNMYPQGEVPSLDFKSTLHDLDEIGSCSVQNILTECHLGAVWSEPTLFAEPYLS